MQQLTALGAGAEDPVRLQKEDEVGDINPVSQHARAASPACSREKNSWETL